MVLFTWSIAGVLGADGCQGPRRGGADGAGGAAGGGGGTSQGLLGAGDRGRGTVGALQQSLHQKKACAACTRPSTARERSRCVSPGNAYGCSHGYSYSYDYTPPQEHLHAAESRARAAESSVAAEVSRRVATALSSRALWPADLREEVQVRARTAAREY